jgi:hypothetical protein
MLATSSSSFVEPQDTGLGLPDVDAATVGLPLAATGAGVGVGVALERSQGSFMVQEWLPVAAAEGVAVTAVLAAGVVGGGGADFLQPPTRHASRAIPSQVRFMGIPGSIRPLA